MAALGQGSPLQAAMHVSELTILPETVFDNLNWLGQVASAWRREKKIKAKKRAPIGQGIPLSPAMHASEGMMQALNGTTPRPHSETVSRKQLTKMLTQVMSYFCLFCP